MGYKVGKKPICCKDGIFFCSVKILLESFTYMVFLTVMSSIVLFIIHAFINIDGIRGIAFSVVFLLVE